MIPTIILVVLAIIILAGALKVVRPTDRGLIERFGKYVRFGSPGLNIVIPFVERIRRVNITEQMVDAEAQEIITNDKLNATVDAQVYFKIRDDEGSVKKSQYSVYNCKVQIVQLARTTLRNIIGTLTLRSANSERNKINQLLYDTLTKETTNWGIDIIRTELKEICPPEDVQETMNRVVKAENEKTAAIDFATAAETQADGLRRAAVKQADGERASAILVARGRAEAIRLVNEAANKYFVGNAQVLKQLETVCASLEKNAKIVLPAGKSLVNVIGSLAGTGDKEN